MTIHGITTPNVAEYHKRFSVGTLRARACPGTELAPVACIHQLWNGSVRGYLDRGLALYHVVEATDWLRAVCRSRLSPLECDQTMTLSHQN